MRSPRLIAALAGATALLFLAGCGESTAPEVLTADDAEVLAARPGTPPGQDRQPPPDEPEPGDPYDAYFTSWHNSDTEQLGYWTGIDSDPPDIPGAEAGIATIVPLCFGDQGWCAEDNRIFHGTWTTVVDEVPDYHRSHRRFNMYHRLDIYQGPGWYGEGEPLEGHVGGFTTSNSITCKALPCSTSGVRLHRKDWVPLDGAGLVTSFDDGIVNLVLESELVAENHNGGDVVVFRARNGGIHGRVVFTWTAPNE
jgi:hypothetical protein